MRKSTADAIRAVRRLERDRDSATLQSPGRVGAVGEWLKYWVENIAAAVVRENTLAGYRVAIRTHLVPGIGAHQLDRLQPEHLEKLYARMIRNGSSPGTAHQAHRTFRTALGEAERRGRITRQPATPAKAPRVSETEVEPYSVDQVRRLLTAAEERENTPAGPSLSRSGSGRVRSSGCAGRTWTSTPGRCLSAAGDSVLATGTDAAARVARRPAFARSGSRIGRRPTRRSRAPDAAPSASRTSWSRS